MAYDGSVKFDTKIDSAGFQRDLGKMKSAAKTAFTAIGAAAAGAVAASAKIGIGFESAFAGVKKTVNATDDQLATLRDGIRGMAKEIPSSANEIAGIAEAAGQLGIKTDSILSFTRVMSDLGVATNLAGDEAASTLAKFANITGMPQENFDRLGSTIVALGNNLATTEADIAAMAMRLAGAGTQVGMTEAQILSFAGALSSVGIEAEAGGSAFSRVMSDMQLAVETNSKDLKKYAKVAGMTGDQFKKSFQKDAAGAILEFVKGLNNTARNGKSATAVLADMGIEEIRLSDALKRAAGASGVFEDAVKLGSEAWEENTALTKEAEQRYATTESKIKILGNSVKDLGITAWDAFSGSFGKSIDSANDKVDDLSRAMSSGELKGALENVGALFGSLVDAAVSLASTALPPLVSALGFLGDNLGSVSAVAISSVVAFKAFSILSTITGWVTANSAVWGAHAAAIAANTAAETRGITVSTLLVSTMSAQELVVGVLTGKLGLLTAAKLLAAKAQAALNAAWAANPIGIVIAGVALLTGAITAVAMATNKETEAEKINRERLEENRKANEDLRKSIDDVRQARVESSGAVRGEFEHVKKLADELETLTDANGRVDEANRGRAQFIIDTLNSALGTEISLTKDARVNYGKLKDSIYDVIEAKKAKALADVYEEDYKNSLAKEKELNAALSQAQRDAAEAYTKVADAKRAENDAQRAYNDTLAEANAKVADGTISTDGYYVMVGKASAALEKAKRATKEAEDAYKPFTDEVEKAEDAIAENNYVIAKSEEAFAALAEGDSQKAIDLFDDLGNAAIYAAEDTDDALKKLGDNYHNSLNGLIGAINNFLKEGSYSAYQLVVDAAKKVESAKGDYEAAGGSISNGLVTGMSGEFDLTELMQRIADASGEMEQKASEAGFNAEEALGGNMDTLSGKILTAKASADDFKTALEKIPDTVNVDIKLNVPEVPKFSRGTLGAPGGPAVVNDGNGPELIEGKDGSFKMVQSKGAALTWLDRGDRVYTAEQTRSFMRRVPHYAKGIGNGGAYSGTVEITSFIDKVPEAFDKAMDELELRRDLDVLDEEQYYAELDALKDKYFAKGSDKWWEYEKEIYNHRKETAEKAAEEAAEAELDEIERRHDLGLLSEQAYIDELTAYRDKYYAEGTEEFVEMTDKINDINRQNELDMMQYGLDIGLLTKRQYYDKLTEYRDKYFAVGSKDWLEYTKEIYQYYVDGIKAAYDELAEYAKEQLADIEAKQETLVQKLADDASFYRTVTIKNAYEDGSDMVFKELKDWTPDIEKVKRYHDAITAAKERVLGSGIEPEYAKIFIDKLMEESVEDGTELAELLVSASDEEFKKHLDGFAEYQKLSEDTAASQYEAETEDAKKAIDAIEKECEVTINAVKELFFGSFTEALEEAGLVVPDGFFDVGEKSAEEFENGFSGSIEEAYQKIKERFNFDVVGGLAVVGDGATTAYSTFAPVYNFNVAGETTVQMIQAAEAASERNKLSGGY